jgi:hypothetical protein
MMLLVIILIALAGFFLFGTGMSNTNCPQPPAPSPQIFSVAAAIALAEGSNPEWNNPGDLTISFGYPTDGIVNSAGVLKFQNCEDGWNALYKQLSAIVNGNSRYSLDITLSMFGEGYSGGNPDWAVNVARALGVSENTTLGEILT